ncbi:H4MPT-linked C1 transfer pathway protein [Methanobrevibacter ruminantium M1]|uniref:H4MPT-linked C1 transfer pathway protein n=1 Tax=Methanobrevibacter ruminantium (strain ATCC 35063 / DSM 1093 / JCM 13430 / OCM 146 / M1) TaxID=634498 RepID=D3DYZ5_METRM|nr:hydantoinase/oxoprolinase family protein [Methanobrevibacter ruminantium]ADC47545.1 H4MPT-linked C1 transfer pathway protein [Methanobrevibacter ruminantium M1]
MKVAGFDIGGANTDLAIIDFENDEIKEIKTDFEYLPMWSDNNRLGNVLIDLIEKICPLEEIDAVGISMTAELVDAFETKTEGVLDIATTCEKLFECPVAYIGVDKVLSLAELVQNPIEVAAANWIATSQIIAEIEKDCIFVDTGSTTTDIIPIKDGRECAKGRTDFERSATGELVYTGTLRTNLTSFVDSVPLNGNQYRVASELFASTADVYNVLGLISEDDFTCATCDGAGKSKEDSARRISRILCADLDILSKEDILEIADYIHKEQVKQIASGLKDVSDREGLTKVVVTGLGKDILCAEAARLLGLEVKSMGDYYTDDECTVAPAIGTAIMMKNYLK